MSTDLAKHTDANDINNSIDLNSTNQSNIADTNEDTKPKLVIRKSQNITSKQDNGHKQKNKSIKKSKQKVKKQKFEASDDEENESNSENGNELTSDGNESDASSNSSFSTLLSSSLSSSSSIDSDELSTSLSSCGDERGDVRRRKLRKTRKLDVEDGEIIDESKRCKKMLKKVTHQIKKLKLKGKQIEVDLKKCKKIIKKLDSNDEKRSKYTKRKHKLEEKYKAVKTRLVNLHAKRSQYETAYEKACASITKQPTHSDSNTNMNTQNKLPYPVLNDKRDLTLILNILREKHKNLTKILDQTMNTLENNPDGLEMEKREKLRQLEANVRLQLTRLDCQIDYVRLNIDVTRLKKSFKKSQTQTEDRRKIEEMSETVTKLLNHMKEANKRFLKQQEIKQQQQQQQQEQQQQEKSQQVQNGIASPASIENQQYQQQQQKYPLIYYQNVPPPIQQQQQQQTAPLAPVSIVHNQAPPVRYPIIQAPIRQPLASHAHLSPASSLSPPPNTFGHQRPSIPLQQQQQQQQQQLSQLSKNPKYSYVNPNYRFSSKLSPNTITTPPPPLPAPTRPKSHNQVPPPATYTNTQMYHTTPMRPQTPPFNPPPLTQSSLPSTNYGYGHQAHNNRDRYGYGHENEPLLPNPSEQAYSHSQAPPSYNTPAEFDYQQFFYKALSTYFNQYAHSTGPNVPSSEYGQEFGSSSNNHTNAQFYNHPNRSQLNKRKRP